MNDSEWLEAVVRNRQPMMPTATNVQPQLQTLSSVRAVIFDVYGTLLISGSGDVGTVDEDDRGAFIGEALAAVGCRGRRAIAADDRRFARSDSIGQRITKGHRLPKTGSRHRRCLAKHACGKSDCQNSPNDTEAVVRLAAEYESRANPTWPMPAAGDLLSRLSESDCALGIVSNAQVFTVNLVQNLVGASLADGGFDLNLCIFSNRFRQAKPGPRLFDVLRAALKRRGLEPGQAIYVGNDMLNDVWAASQAGLKTAWFAGDGRSCRPRDDDPRCRSLRPDIVITDLMQLPDCLEIG